MIKTLLSILIMTGVFYIGYGIYTFLYDIECGVSDIEVIKSPKDNSRIYKFSRSCGATTPIVIHLLYSETQLNIDGESIGNLFIAKPCQKMSIQWTSPGQILVNYPCEESGIYIKQNSMLGIRAKYTDSLQNTQLATSPGF